MIWKGHISQVGKHTAKDTAKEREKEKGFTPG